MRSPSRSRSAALVAHVVLWLTTIGCQAQYAHRSQSHAAPADGLIAASETEDTLPADSFAGSFGRAAEDPAAAPPASALARQMIYTAAFALEVARVDVAIQRFVTQIESLGGHLARRHNDQVVARVPAEHFSSLLAELRKYGRVLDETIETRDVTREHRDLGIRLDNAKTTRTRLLALLEKATAVEDLLAIEEQLRRLTDEIERMEGELKYLDDQIAMSTVSVDFHGTAARNQPRKPSRFFWINQIGAERVLSSF